MLSRLLHLLFLLGLTRTGAGIAQCTHTYTYTAFRYSILYISSYFFVFLLVQVQWFNRLFYFSAFYCIGTFFWINACEWKKQNKRREIRKYFDQETNEQINTFDYIVQICKYANDRVYLLGTTLIVFYFIFCFLQVTCAFCRIRCMYWFLVGLFACFL